MDPHSRRQHPSPTSQAKPDSTRWTVPNLMDFDYYVDADEQAIHEYPAERARLSERDRGLYLEQIRDALDDSSPEHSPSHRSAALRLWLGQRRAAETPELRRLLPGASFARGQRLVTVGLGILGCVLGASVASTLLQYDGEHPVNVSWYLFWLVLLQILLAATTLSAWALRRSRLLKTAMEDVSLLSRLIRPLFSRVSGWVQQQRLNHATAEIRDQAKAKTGLLQSHYALYGPASYLPVLIAAQIFGIGFNLGAITSTVALEWFSDLAFGWGSALDVQPQSIYDLVRYIALPWSWAFGEGIGFPTLEQIAGSRISLKDSLSTLDSGDLRAWRWFLVLAVVTYGLLPRLLLLGLSMLTQARTLAALPFTHQRTQALYARMVTPNLETAVAGSGTGPAMPIPQPLAPLTAPTAAPRPSTAPNASPTPKPKPESQPKSTPKPTPGPSPAPATTTSDTSAPQPRKQEHSPGGPEKQQSAEDSQPEPLRELQPSPLQAADHEPPSASAATIAADACVLMIHLDVADVLEESDQIRLQQMLLAHTGWRVAASVTIGGGSAMTDQALELISKGHWDAPPPRVAIIQDGSQPPITEHLRFLRTVRAEAGEQAQILLALVGDPDGEDPLPPVSDFDLTDWQRKIEQMGDPYLRLDMLAAPETGANLADEVSR